MNDLRINPELARKILTGFIRAGLKRVTKRSQVIRVGRECTMIAILNNINYNRAVNYRVCVGSQ